MDVSEAEVFQTGRGTTVIVKDMSAVITEEFVDCALTVNVNVPVAEGDPDRTFWDNVMLFGIVPDTSEYPAGLAFVADRVIETETEVDVFDREDPVDHEGVVATNCVNDRSAVAFVALPVALMVNEYDPALGVPFKSPALDSDRPVGRVPVCKE